jgi:hypothetical protein
VSTLNNRGDTSLESKGGVDSSRSGGDGEEEIRCRQIWGLNPSPVLLQRDRQSVDRLLQVTRPHHEEVLSRRGPPGRPNRLPWGAQLNFPPKTTLFNISRQIPLDEGILALSQRERPVDGFKSRFSYSSLPYHGYRPVSEFQGRGAKLLSITAKRNFAVLLYLRVNQLLDKVPVVKT